MRTRRILIAVTAAALLAAAGCSGDDKKPTGEGKIEAPAGGWPQPENGQITDKMCGLITPADYQEFGHTLLLPLTADQGTRATSNGVFCTGVGDVFTLTLQPTAESAKVYYGGLLAGRKSQVISGKQDTILAESLVTGADESWFDYSVGSGNADERKDYELTLRRGALVVSLVLSHADEAEKDPKGTLVALGDRVLQRVGDLGRTDTGVTPILHLQAGGKGKAAQIQYSAPDREVKTLKDVKLPWKADLPLADHGDQPQNLSLNVQSPFTTGSRTWVSCRILVDDKIRAEHQNTGFAGCLGMTR